MTSLNFEDFYKVPEIKFDISKLRKDLDAILEKKRFNSPGVTHFGAIPLNQIPNDEESIKGNNIRGRYWTIADETGKEVSRDIDIDESKYTQLVPEFENTYFKEVYEILSKKFKLGTLQTPRGNAIDLNLGGAHACFKLLREAAIKEVR